MTKRIALFNHKGGVSKTTTTFNLGWMLASQGHRTVLVDADPQCNLTGMVLGYKGPDQLEEFYEEDSERNFMAGLAPAFESRPAPIEGVEALEIEGIPGLYLLPGHLRISEYEVTLGIAQELSGSIQTLQNLPGSILYLLESTAEMVEANYVLIDMSPGLGPINQNLLTTSDFFIVPTSPDFFSVMAIDSLARILPRWQKWAVKANSMDILRSASYPFPEPHAKFLGTVVQKYRPRSGVPATAFQKWIDQIHEKVETNLLPALESVHMALEKSQYEAAGIAEDHCLATIADFNSLIAKSQEAQTPIFALSAEQLGQAGVVLQATERSRDAFLQIFHDLADKVTLLTDDNTASALSD
jgi:cellulose biosynthesis protein BcsQ